MALALKRTDLQVLAQSKLDDAIVLLQNQRFSNAYYLAGYAIEIGLKACIAKQFFAETIPDKAFVNRIYDHNLENLVAVAGLGVELRSQENRDPVFAANWFLATRWNPENRYDFIDSDIAQATIEAIANNQSGVFQWIKARW
jgi:hypothetical protein